MRKLLKFSVCVLLLAPVSVTLASELVWAPINPSFIGGNAYNAQWLMSSAQAQNKHIERTARSTPSRNLLEDFQHSLNRQILYRLSNKIVDAAFGAEGLDSGYYDLGDYTIDVTVDIEGINVVITDTATGDITTVQVPYY